jgi:hypothetical protein
MSQKHAKRKYVPRMKILNRDGFLCGYCFENQATTVDHIVPVAFRDDPRQENLIASCTRCNSIAGSMVFDSLELKREYIQGVIKRSPKWQKRTDVYVPVAVATEERHVPKAQVRKQPAVEVKPKVEKKNDVFTQSVVRESLKALIEHFGFTADGIPVEEMQGIADRLSQMAGKSPAWGWRYLRNFLNKKIEASPKLIDAIMRLGMTVDDTPALLVMTEPVTVRAFGKVKPGSVILADSRPCGRPGCRVEFVPRVPWQRFCSGECRKREISRGGAEARRGKKEGGK